MQRGQVVKLISEARLAPASGRQTDTRAVRASEKSIRSEGLACDKLPTATLKLCGSPATIDQPTSTAPRAEGLNHYE